MRASALLLLCAAAQLFGGVDGTLVNQTSGKPQPNVTVTLAQPGHGLQTLGTARTDAQGHFAINASAQGPMLLQTTYQGVEYFQMIPPGSPTSGLQVPVYDATSKPGTAHVSQHMFLLQPNDKGIAVNETLLLRNDTKTAYSNPAKGDLDFYLPPGAGGSVQVTVTAPDGLPVPRDAEKAAGKDVYKVNYPLKPGETRFDLAYTLPETANPRVFASKLVQKEGATRIVVPNGVTIEGDGLTPLGQEPSTQANIYDIKGDAFTVKLEGSGTLAAGDGSSDNDDSGAPKITEVRPYLYTNLYPILGLSFAILALGFVVMYRARPSDSAPKGKQRG
jgi:hypothetical protein